MITRCNGIGDPLSLKNLRFYTPTSVLNDVIMMTRSESESRSIVLCSYTRSEWGPEPGNGHNMTYSIETTRNSGYTYEPRIANKSPCNTKIISSRNRAYTYMLTCEDCTLISGIELLGWSIFSGVTWNLKSMAAVNFEFAKGTLKLSYGCHWIGSNKSG